MICIEEHVHVAGDASEAFAFLTDFRNLPSWDPGIAEATKTDDGEGVGLGTTYRVVASFLGRKVPMRYRVTRYDPEACRAVLVGDTPTLTATDIIEVTSAESGARVHWRAEFRFKGPLALAERLTKPLFQRLGRKAMDGLRRSLGRR